MVQKAVGFKQCRFHGIFNDWMGCCKRTDEGAIVTNFVNVDKAYQGILDLGMKPFVELGFMPEVLASGSQTCFHYKANVTPPRDYTEWCDFINEFVQHLIDQFGKNEVCTWRFEVWNEPDLSYFWEGADMDEYFKLYEATVRTIKSIDAGIRVGGPATSKNAWVREMLAYCESTNTPLDFISTHHYSSDSALEIGLPSTEIMYFGQKKMLNDVSMVRQLIDDSAFPTAELHYTEWNISPVHNDRFGKDSEFTMTFILQTLKDLGDIPDSYSFWAINDIFEESGPGEGPYSGKYGLVNIHGIPKPAFHAYAFLSQLFDHEHLTDNESLIATTDGENFRLLAWNHCEPSSHDFSGADWIINEKEHHETIQLHGLNGRYRICAWQVDRTMGNSYRAWQEMGEPFYLTKKNIEALNQAAEPVLVKDEIVIADSDLQVMHTLPTNALIYYEISAC
ncbi:beta-xylosidase [Cerasicoccus arenae]|uniref:Beta-xylosidase n=2 Tax=Cerasicoccus arenae TaxID=424488 RepID=A0A8J3GEP5_9BACT|nr:beta-xylosidase [Cerasicoccus arenae]